MEATDGEKLNNRLFHVNAAAQHIFAAMFGNEKEVDHSNPPTGNESFHRLASRLYDIVEEKDEAFRQNIARTRRALDDALERQA